MSMETEKKREWLMRGWRVEQRIRAREERIREMKERMRAVRMSNLSGMPQGGPRRDWTDAVDAIEDETNALVREIAELGGVQRDVRRVIERMEPSASREILEYRYLMYLGWPEIAQRMDYQERYTYKLHNKALEKLDIERQGGSVI